MHIVFQIALGFMIGVTVVLEGNAGIAAVIAICTWWITDNVIKEIRRKK
jgi:hypothetical protein